MNSISYRVYGMVEILSIIKKTVIKYNMDYLEKKNSLKRLLRGGGKGMGIKIGRYSFKGPFSSLDEINEQEGIYAILSHLHKNLYLLVEIGESDKVKTELEKNINRMKEEKNSDKQILFTVNYTSNLKQPGRAMIVREILEEYKRTSDTKTKH
jgi:hypothetical protein